MNTLTAEKRDLKTKAKKLRKEGYVIGKMCIRDSPYTVYRTEVEFDTLSDTDWSRTKYHDFFLS